MVTPRRIELLLPP